MKTWQKILIWVLWIIVFVVACELTDYWTRRGLLRFWYVDAIEGMFLVLGFTLAKLPVKSSKTTKRKQK